MHCLARFFKKLNHKFDPFPQNQQNQKNYNLKIENRLKYFTEGYPNYSEIFSSDSGISQTTFFDKFRDCI